jgi:hypothetical protein
MKMTRNMLAAACVLLVGLPLQLIGEEPDGALEQARIETFADALMDEEMEFIYAHVNRLDLSAPENQELMDWFMGGIYFVRPVHVVSSYPVQLPSQLFTFSGVGVSIPAPELDGPTLSMRPDSDWLLVLETMMGDEWGELIEHLESISENHPVTPGNVYKVFRHSHGGICVNEGWLPPAPGPNLKREQVYPVSVIREVHRIYDVMSSGGDTNALLALEQELEVDFSQKLVREIVRRKQPPPPPTQEEIWREEIDNAWGMRYKEGEVKRKLPERLAILEAQFRSAHEAGELSNETYLELMKLIRLDLEQNPKATHLRHTTPPRSPSAPAQP